MRPLHEVAYNNSANAIAQVLAKLLTISLQLSSLKPLSSALFLQSNEHYPCGKYCEQAALS
jgi:hypothetical protein